MYDGDIQPFLYLRDSKEFLSAFSFRFFFYFGCHFHFFSVFFFKYKKHFI